MDVLLTDENGLEVCESSLWSSSIHICRLTLIFWREMEERILTNCRDWLVPDTTNVCEKEVYKKENMFSQVCRNSLAVLGRFSFSGARCWWAWQHKIDNNVTWLNLWYWWGGGQIHQPPTNQLTHTTNQPPNSTQPPLYSLGFLRAVPRWNKIMAVAYLHAIARMKHTLEFCPPKPHTKKGEHIMDVVWFGGLHRVYACSVLRWMDVPARVLYIPSFLKGHGH